MKLPSLSLVVLDTETTGLVPRTHEIIEFASMRCEAGKVVDTYECLFTTEEIPSVVEVLTRIRQEDVTGKRKFSDCIDEVKSVIADDTLIVGQNVQFDLGMLKGSGLDLTERPWIDTSMLASIVFPELESYSLGYVSEVLKLDHSPKHRALGDVRATLELLSRCWERLLEITPEMQKQLLAYFGKSSPGLKLLASALPEATAKESPTWISLKKRRPAVHAEPLDVDALCLPAAREIAVREEPLDPSFLASLLEAAAKDQAHRDWFVVKNLDASVRRFSQSIQGKQERVRILYPSYQLLDSEAASRLQQSEVLLADEATLALKIDWYQPKTRNDFPLHGGEEAVWNGKLASTEETSAYRDQFEDLPQAVLIDQRQFLQILEEDDHPAHAPLKEPTHVLVDDASMLEDTATKAYGWTCVLDHLRAASQNHPLLTRFTDLLQLWVEKVRQSQDVRYLSPSDLTSSEAKGLREQLAEVEEDKSLSAQVRAQLAHVARILDPENLASRIAWIDLRQDGGQVLQSVPEHVSAPLASSLYQKYPTTLLIPPGSRDDLCEVIPNDVAVKLFPVTGAAGEVGISFPTVTLDEVLLNLDGKTIVLLSGRGPIENAYVKHAVALEEKGVTMICQGVNGGQGRMRAEFLAAPAPAVWLQTTWNFEGVELPPGTVDHLVLGTLPFDYLSHPILSRRAARYRDSFSEYFFPRLLQRLFRILRTFSRFKTVNADVRLIDDRVRTKEYGKKIAAYLSRFAPGVEQPIITPKEKKPKLKKPAKPKGEEPPKTGKKGQLALF